MDIYSCFPVRGCVDMNPSALHCPEPIMMLRRHCPRYNWNIVESGVKIITQPFTNMSRHWRSKESPLRVTCEWPYVPSNENGDCENMKMLLNVIPC